jgi:predicted transposase YbfD/YdcC
VPALALSRAAAHAVESDAEGQYLGADTWARLEALPDPRSAQGRIYPLACLVAVAVCAMTAAGHDRLTAVGQWIKRAEQQDLVRLRLPWDPVAGRFRVPDEKTIRVVLDRLDPRALTRALLGPRRRARSQAGTGVPGAVSRSVRRYRARRRAEKAKALARRRIRAVAVDGKTSRGARRGDGTRVHLLGVVEHGAGLLDHLEVDAKHNETSHFTELLAPLDLTSVAVTFDALHTVRANLAWLVTAKNAHYIAVVKKNQPLLHAKIKTLPWRAVPGGSATRETGHGRTETRTLKAAHIDRLARLDFPYARQAIKITRWRQDNQTRKITRETVYVITSLTSAQASPDDLARLVREHWHVEVHHHIRDVTFTEDHATSRTGHGPTNLATIRAAIINAIKDAGYLHIPEGRRDHTTVADTLYLHGLTT